MKGFGSKNTTRIEGELFAEEKDFHVVETADFAWILADGED